jgi:hypothetical protein
MFLAPRLLAKEGLDPCLLLGRAEDPPIYVLRLVHKYPVDRHQYVIDPSSAAAGRDNDVMDPAVNLCIESQPNSKVYLRPKGVSQQFLTERAYFAVKMDGKAGTE